jgi:beta-lactamase regulating signal transducer with metallopeptidase domain/protein involved in polysaccharide export with SLBB domain/tetratricopeptide (TPR) repeat protein
MNAWLLAGWTMLHFLWAGALAAAAGAIVRLAVRRCGPNVRYATSLAMLAAAACAPVLIAGVLARNPELMASAWEPPALPADGIADETASHSAADAPGVPRQSRGLTVVDSLRESQSGATDGAETFVELKDQPGGDAARSDLRSKSATVGDSLRESRKAADVAAVNPAEEAPGLTNPADGAPGLKNRGLRGDVVERVVGALPFVWLVGAPVTFLLLAAGLVGSRRLTRSGMPLVEGRAAEACARLRGVLKVSRRVALAAVEGLTQPVLVGIVKPTILLPAAALNGWTVEELEMVLVHELAHVRRWDNLVNLGQRVIEAALFFHPCVWLASRQVRRDREECCDAIVVQHTQAPEAYAELLINVASSLRSEPGRPRPGSGSGTSRLAGAVMALAGASPMAQHALVGRVRRILKLEDDPMWISRRMMGLLVVLGICMLAFIRGALAVPEPIKVVTGEGAATSVDEANYPMTYQTGNLAQADLVELLRLAAASDFDIAWHDGKQAIVIATNSDTHGLIAQLLKNGSDAESDGRGAKLQTADDASKVVNYVMADIKAVDPIAWLRITATEGVNVRWFEENKSVVINASQEVHEKIADLLEASRRAQAARRSAPTWNVPMLQLQQQLQQIDRDLADAEVMKQVAIQQPQSRAALDEAVAAELDRDPQMEIYKAQISALNDQIQNLNDPAVSAAGADHGTATRALLREIGRIQRACDDYRKTAAATIRERLSKVPNEAMHAAMVEHNVRVEYLTKKKAELEKQLRELEAKLTTGEVEERLGDDTSVETAETSLDANGDAFQLLDAKALKARIEISQTQLAQIERELAEAEVMKLVAIEQAQSGPALDAAVAAELAKDRQLEVYREQLTTLSQQTAAARENGLDPDVKLVKRLTQLRNTLRTYQAEAEAKARERLAKIPNEVLQNAILEHNIRVEQLKARKAGFEDSLRTWEALLKQRTASQATEIADRPATVERAFPFDAVLFECAKLLGEAPELSLQWNRKGDSLVILAPQRVLDGLTMCADAAKGKKTSSGDSMKEFGELFAAGDDNPPVTVEYAFTAFDEMAGSKGAAIDLFEGYVRDPYGPQLPISWREISGGQVEVTMPRAGHAWLRLMTTPASPLMHLAAGNRKADNEGERADEEQHSGELSRAEDIVRTPEAVHAYTLGMEAAKNGESIEALGHFADALRADNSYVDVYVAKGDVLRSIKEYDNAATAYSQALDLDNSLAPAYHGRGECYLALSPPDYNLALSDLEKAVDLDPRNAQARQARNKLRAMGSVPGEATQADENGPKATSREIELFVTSDASAVLDGVSLSRADLAARLAGRGEVVRRVRLRADATRPYTDVIAWMDALHAAGVRDIGVETQAATPGPGASDQPVVARPFSVKVIQSPIVSGSRVTAYLEVTMRDGSQGLQRERDAALLPALLKSDVVLQNAFDKVAPKFERLKQIAQERPTTVWLREQLTASFTADSPILELAMPADDDGASVALMTAVIEELKLQLSSLEGSRWPTEEQSTAAPRPYRIGPGDTLLVRAIGTAPDWPVDGEFIVEEEGTIALGPAYGRVEVARLTVREAEGAVLKTLKEILSDPKVQLTIAKKARGASSEARDADEPLAIVESPGPAVESGDLLWVEVEGTLPDQPIKGLFTVSRDGELQLGASYGVVKIAGLNSIDAETRVRQKLSEVVSDPRVEVRVVKKARVGEEEDNPSTATPSWTPGPHSPSAPAGGTLLRAPTFSTPTPADGVHIVPFRPEFATIPMPAEFDAADTKRIADELSKEGFDATAVKVGPTMTLHVLVQDLPVRPKAVWDTKTIEDRQGKTRPTKTLRLVDPDGKAIAPRPVNQTLGVAPLPAERTEGASPSARSGGATPLYDGKTFDEWRAQWRTELKIEKRMEAVEALAAFARAEYGREAAEAILDVAGDYRYGGGGGSGVILGEIVETLSGRGSDSLAPDLWLPLLVERVKQAEGAKQQHWRDLLDTALRQWSNKRDQPSDFLMALAKDEVAGVQSAAIYALVREMPTNFDLGDPRIVELVRSSLRGDAPDLALLKLIRFRDPDQVPEVLQLLVHQDPEIQWKARQILHSHDSLPPVYEPLVEIAFGNGPVNQRIAAIRALATMGQHLNRHRPPELITKLQTLLASTEEEELLMPTMNALLQIKSVTGDHLLVQLQQEEELSPERLEELRASLDKLPEEGKQVRGDRSPSGGSGFF